MKFIPLTLALGLTLALLTGCESDEDKDIFAAQLCVDELDTSSSNTNLANDVDACVAPIAGYSSQEAAVIKCASDFIRAGISESRLVDAITNLEDTDAGGDPTAAAMTTLSFGTTDAAKTAAATAVENCKASQSSSLEGLAGLANISTIIAYTAAQIPGDGEIETLLDDFNPSEMTDADKIALANTILDSQESLCDSESGILADEEVCGDLNDAVADNGGEELTEAQKQQLINDFMANLDPDNT